MDDISQVSITECKESSYLRPVRMHFKQAGKMRDWDIMKVHDSVYIVIFNVSRDVLIFVRQFRPAVYFTCLKHDECDKEVDTKKYPGSLGMVLELCAGIVDKDQSLHEIARDEVFEECGYEVPLASLQKVTSYRKMSSRKSSDNTLAQEAQSYLERNVVAWMQPRPHEGKATSSSPPVLVPSSSVPHSLCCSLPSSLPGTSYSTPSCQPSAAASFFARAAQRLNLSPSRRRKRRKGVEEAPLFRTHFCDVLKGAAPPAPPSLIRARPREGSGKVKVMVRMAPSAVTDSFLGVDAPKKVLTIRDPSSVGAPSPKMFTFDAVFLPDDTQAEVCSSALPEVIQAVVGGSDGCLCVYGHPKLGKTRTLVGSSDSTQGLGAAPCAVAWLFRLLQERRTRFVVRVSALEVSPAPSGRLQLRDLLAEHAAGTDGSGGMSPGIYLREDAQIMHHSELRAPTIERAGYLLDAALAARTDGEDDGRNSHFLFTLHVYQYRMERGGKGGVAGGRSRLHLFDLGSCEKLSAKTRDSGSPFTLTGLGNVLLSLFSGQNHVPYRESKLTQLLKEATSSPSCRIAMIAHIATSPLFYSEILGTVQLAAKIHRIRRKKIKYSGNVVLETTHVEKRAGLVCPSTRMLAEDCTKSGSSDPDYTSSSEQSCDTVIYVGTGIATLDNRDKTHNEIVHKTNKIDSSVKSEPPSNLCPQASGTSSWTCRGTNTTLNSNMSRNEDHLEDVASSSAYQSTSTTSEAAVVRTASSGAYETRTDDHEEPDDGVEGSYPQKKRHRATQVRNEKSSLKNKEQQTAPGVIKGPNSVKIQSDEMWIDGPRFIKPKFDFRTLHRLQKEQWVDGPPAMYGFMDDHKQGMIRKWVQEHSHPTPDSEDKKLSEVWIDFPHDKEESKCKVNPKNYEDTNIVQQKADETLSSQQCSSVEDKTGDIFLNFKGTKSDTTGKMSNFVEGRNCCLNRPYEAKKFLTCKTESEANTANHSACVDKIDNEENTASSGLDSNLHTLHTGCNETSLKEFNSELFETQKTHFESIKSNEHFIETMEEVEESEQPACTIDRCLQVNEEDIIAECWLPSLYRNSENSLPESDQGSCDDKEHSRRCFSADGLDLPSSFTDARSMSVELDSMSIPDTCRDTFSGHGGVTWRLLYGNMFQKIKEQQQKKNMDLAMNRRLLTGKLEQIDKLSELIQPITKREHILEDDSLSTYRSKIRSLASGVSQQAFSDMLHHSSDSSTEDLSEMEINSTQSGPAALDIDKCDYKFNVKPMKGLKLEAFYNKIHRVCPFSEQYSIRNPSLFYNPLSSDDLEVTHLQKDPLKSDIVKQRSYSFSHRPSLNAHSSNNSTFSLQRTVIADQPSSSKIHNFESFGYLEDSPAQYRNKYISLKNHSNDASHVNTFENSFLPENASGSDVIALKSDQIIHQLERKCPKNGTNIENYEISKRTEFSNEAATQNYKNIDKYQATMSPPLSGKSIPILEQTLIDDVNATQLELQISESPSSSLQNKSISSPISKSAEKSRVPSKNSTRNLDTKCRSNNNANFKRVGQSNRPAGSANISGCNKCPAHYCSTSSSTSGVTSDCSSAKQMNKFAQSTSFATKQKHCGESTTESRKADKSISICRSTSSPSTRVDTIQTDVVVSEHYRVTCHASGSGNIAFPYHKSAHINGHRRQKTGDRRSSESGPSEKKPLLLEGNHKQQFSGTSSGYESMLRDSEGTPLSSSQDSGNEDSISKAERGRKCRRKSEGSSQRSSSAPARGPPSRGLSSDEDVCCRSLLCCRLLDFY